MSESQVDKVNYYETEYNGSCLGLGRYITNFCKQAKLVPSNVVVAFGMAFIEVVEFLATLQINVLLAPKDVDYILAWTLYTYLALFIIKFIDLAWLVFSQWDSQQIGVCQKIVQWLSLWTFSCFLPYGDFIVDIGYKMYATPEMSGSQELYPEHYVMRKGLSQMKGYKGKVGGHMILMFNGFITTFVNWVLLVIVLVFFTPAIFP